MSLTAVIFAFSACHWAVSAELCSCSSASSRSSASLRFLEASSFSLRSDVSSISSYIADRFLPDKAIDLIDEAASRLRIEIDSMPEEIDELKRRAMQRGDPSPT